MASLRKTAWFVMVAILMAGWMGVLGSMRGVAEAGIIASRLSEAAERSEDLSKVQSFLENKIVLQKLVDYGVSPEEAKAKVQTMSAQDLHRLASLTDRVGDGADGLGLLIGLAILIILIIVILKLMHKEVIIR